LIVGLAFLCLREPLIDSSMPSQTSNCQNSPSSRRFSSSHFA
jgi:hypothetical protein